MPIFLDQSLRKALLSRIKDSFSQDTDLAGKARVLEQESFIPEVENQVILTDLHLTNDSLDSGNRVTDLSGRVTFAPLGRPTVSFLSWAQENPNQEQLVDHGFYQITINKTEDPFIWTATTDVIERIVRKKAPWLGLKISLDAFTVATDIDLKKLSVTQDNQEVSYKDDFILMDTCIYLRRYIADTKVFYDGTNITDQCSYLDLVSHEINLTGISRPIPLPVGALLDSITVWDLIHKRPLRTGWEVSQRGVFSWKNPCFKGGRVLIQYYTKKPLLFWKLPEEFKFKIEKTPLVYKDGKSSLIVSSSIRGILPETAYELDGSILSVYEPYPKESVSIDYRSYIKTLGPHKVLPASYNDQIIPGISLTFTDNFSDGDQSVVIRHDHKKAIGQENGGTNRVELSLKLRSSDDKLLERMTARIYYLFTNQESLFELTNQGISLENTVSYGRSYEDRDGNSEKWIVNTFQLVIHHTWRYLIPYITDLNSTQITTGFIEASGYPGAPSFKDLLMSATPDNWVQDY